jgi:DNA-binding transcriptional MerR regulator
MGVESRRGSKVAAGRVALSREEIAALRTIGEVAEHLDLPPHVLRFWETRFKELDPVKRAGGRRFYRPRDIELVEAIRHLLYREGYTIKGVQRILEEQGIDAVIAAAPRRGEGGAPAPPASARAAEPEPAAARVEPTIEVVAPASENADRPKALDPLEPQLLVRLAEPPPSADPSPSPLPQPEPAPSLPVALPPPVFNAPVIVTTRLDQEQAQILRGVLAEIEECKRLLNLTRR